MSCTSWGKYPEVNQKEIFLEWLHEQPSFSDSASVLPYGLGRSYGDCCLNHDNTILVTNKLDRFIDFDAEQGLLTAEAGVSLEDIIRLALPQGWFLPVSPGTKFVTLGGAIANDIHGKNHHVAGTFGNFVRQLRLLRSNGEIITCSETENADLFRATIAGLGLTGLILSATVQLKAVSGPLIDQDNIKFSSLDEFFEISKESHSDFDYTVAWLDCISSGESFGRGIFMRGNHSKQVTKKYFKKNLPLTVPFNFPAWALNKYSVKAFNFCYYNKQRERVQKSTVNFDPFFYPLDAVKNWNRIYGAAGFLQFQCVVPPEPKHESIKKILKLVVESGKASFLAVFKEFGEIKSPGMLSFPRPGPTLCLDFPNTASTRRLLLELDQIVKSSGGASYPAKDALIPPESFRCYYPAWKDFKEYKDPGFSSSLWRRVTGED